MKRTRKYKHLTLYRPREPVCPNAADRRYYESRILDLIVAFVSGGGFFTAMVFLAIVC